MANSFVEEATLTINDRQAKASIRSLTSDINKLLSMSRKLNNIKLFNTSTVQAKRQIDSLARSINKLPKSRTVTVNTRNVTTNVTRNQTIGQRARSARAGVGVSVPTGVGGSRIFANAATGIGAMTTAAFAAAGALRMLAREGAKTDRTNLLLAAAATPGQASTIRAGAANRTTGPIRLTDNEFIRLAQSLLGDVGGNEQQRGIAATNIAKQLETQVLPRLFAQNPEATREDVLTGLRTLVKGMNLASTEIVDTAGNLTKDAQRVLNAQLIAMQADPDLTAQQIQTVLANLKTSAFQLDTEALARVFINAGSRGQRVGNETFRMQQAFQGQLDIKALNNNLERLGLLINPEHNRQGNVIAGTGTVVDQQLLAENPATWIAKYVTAPMMKELAKITPDIPVTNAEIVDYLNSRVLPGASSAAKQGLSDFVLGDEQMRNSIAQAVVVGTQDITQALNESWTAQMTSVSVSFKDSTAAFGNAVAQFVNAAGILSGVADLINNNPNAAAGGAAVAAGVGGIVAVRAGLNFLRGLVGAGAGAATGAATGAAGSVATATGVGAAAAKAGIMGLVWAALVDAAKAPPPDQIKFRRAWWQSSEPQFGQVPANVGAGGLSPADMQRQRDLDFSMNFIPKFDQAFTDGANKFEQSSNTAADKLVQSATAFFDQAAAAGAAFGDAAASRINSASPQIRMPSDVINNLGMRPDTGTMKTNGG